MGGRLPSLLLLLFSLYISAFSLSNNLTSPYLSPSLFFANYQKMLETFNIFIYQPQKPNTFSTSVESLFHSSLLKTPFAITQPLQAHLFYLSFPRDSSSRSISRLIRDLRTDLPFWNRTLGADHFYVSSNGMAYESDRNLVELKKNSVQISCFPSIEGRLIPHKDLTLPPLFENHDFSIKTAPNKRFLCYVFNQIPEISLKELKRDSDFLIESNGGDESIEERISSSRFCLFFYGGDLSHIGNALRYGCVPVLMISDRPILDLPFMDVLRWSEIAIFVKKEERVKEFKNVLDSTCGEKYQRMRDLGMGASKHFVWNSSPQPYDAFYTILYQLWMRRHTIRYARREWI